MCSVRKSNKIKLLSRKTSRTPVSNSGPPSRMPCECGFAGPGVYFFLFLCFSWADMQKAKSHAPPHVCTLYVRCMYGPVYQLPLIGLLSKGNGLHCLLDRTHPCLVTSGISVLCWCMVKVVVGVGVVVAVDDVRKKNQFITRPHWLPHLGRTGSLTGSSVRVSFRPFSASTVSQPLPLSTGSHIIIIISASQHRNFECVPRVGAACTHFYTMQNDCRPS